MTGVAGATSTLLLRLGNDRLAAHFVASACSAVGARAQLADWLASSQYQVPRKAAEGGQGRCQAAILGHRQQRQAEFGCLLAHLWLQGFP